MKKFAFTTLFAAVMLAGCNNAQTPNTPASATSTPAIGNITEQSSETQKIGYIIGFNAGQELKEGGADDLDLEAVYAGLKDAYSDKDSALSEQHIEEVMKAYIERKQAEEEVKIKEAATKNAKEGEAFLAENLKKDGVQVTDSGLQYKVIKEGSGTSPSATDEVAVHYEGRLIDGTVFDSSYERGAPAFFPLNQVIPGWTEGVQLMKPGAQYEFYIPSALAYGETGNPAIEPNSVLIFKIELLTEEQAQTAQLEMQKAQEAQMQQLMQQMQGSAHADGASEAH